MLLQVGKATAEAGLSWAEDYGKGWRYIIIRMQIGDCAGRAGKIQFTEEDWLQQNVIMGGVGHLKRYLRFRHSQS